MQKNPFLRLLLAGFLGLVFLGMWMSWIAMKNYIECDNVAMTFWVPIILVITTIGVTGSSGELYAHYKKVDNQYVALVLAMIVIVFTAFDVISNACGYTYFFTGNESTTFGQLWENSSTLPSLLFWFAVFLVITTSSAPLVVWVCLEAIRREGR